MTRTSAKGLERVLPLLLALFGAFLLLTDRAAAEDETPVEDNYPEILSGALSPSSIGYLGGNVQISAEVVDDFGVSTVYAQVNGSDGFSQAIQLFEGGGNVYYGTLEVPTNFSEFPASYMVEIQVYDTANNYNATTIGDVQVEAAPQFDEAPYVTNAELNPSFLPSAGGPVTISADAGDNRGISEVLALVTFPGGGSEVIPMGGISSSRFEGTFNAPSNAGPPADEYLVEVIAYDDIGQEGRATAGTITVDAPPVISAGRLEVLPGSRAFGTVQVGKAATRKVTIRNLPRRDGAPVEAVLQIVGSAAFSLPGGIGPFTLAPGEKRVVEVEFRPAAAGDLGASLQVVRPDGGQPGLAVELSGRGQSRGKGAKG